MKRFAFVPVCNSSVSDSLGEDTISPFASLLYLQSKSKLPFSVMIMSTTTMGTASLTENNKSNDEHASHNGTRRVSLTITNPAPSANSTCLSSSIDILEPVKDPSPSCVGVRFNLRKRVVNDDRREVVLNSCNSAFLSDLFADIACANDSSADDLTQGEDSRFDPTASFKKSRVSMTRSISRCRKSVANLKVMTEGVSQDPCASPSAVAFFDESSSFSTTKDSLVTTTRLSRVDSLSYQLRCVSSSISDGSEPSTFTFSAALAFPHLPATVSNSSCENLSSLTRSNSDRLLSDTETSTKDSYGWFVETEEEECAIALIHYALNGCKKIASTSTLSFSAVTAPKRVNYDAELEWAQAADTVDDVLGDFF